MLDTIHQCSGMDETISMKEFIARWQSEFGWGQNTCRILRCEDYKSLTPLYRGPSDRWASGIGCAEVSHVAVRLTPDTRLNDPIVQACNKWVFRPAQLNNQPVAVKVLLEIPL